MKIDLALNKVQVLMCHKPKQSTKPSSNAGASRNAEYP